MCNISFRSPLTYKIL
ncbi:hypothetical protein [Polaribacter sp. KT25b]